MELVYIGSQNHTSVHLNQSNQYVIKRVTDDVTLTVIPMQTGPIKEDGANGIYIEDLIAIAAHRLRQYNSGEWKHPLNDAALTCLNNALASLNARTADRVARGVINTDAK